MSDFDIHWPHGWQTVSGYPARLLASDLQGNSPYAFAILRDGDEIVKRYDSKGLSRSAPETYRLVNIQLPVKDGDEHLREALQKAEGDLDGMTRERNEFRRQRDEAFEVLSKYASTLDDMGIEIEGAILQIKAGPANG